MLTPEEKRKRQREASRRWKENNPEGYKDACKKQEAKRKGINRYNSETRKKWYEKNKQSEEWTQKLRDQDNLRYKKVQEFLRAYKLEKGCADCGYKQHHAALEFDHIENKSFNVCNATSITAATKEIKKCEVRCSNCHKIITFNRIQENKPSIQKVRPGYFDGE